MRKIFLRAVSNFTHFTHKWGTLRLVRRDQTLLRSWIASGLAVLVGLILAGFLFASLGIPPLEALYVFCIAPIRDWYGVAELLLKSTPLMLISAGLALGFRARIWNIGAEGQFILGGIFATLGALFFHGVDSIFVLPVVLLMGVLGGVLWAFIPAFLKVRFGANEILSSLLLVYVAGQLLSYLVFGPLKDPAGFNFPQSKYFSDSALMPLLWSQSRLHVGFLIALCLIVGVWYVQKHHRVGLALRLMGTSPRAALFGGFSPNRMVYGTLLLTGAFAGLAGAFEVTGPIGQLQPIISPGYGFTAIIVAFLGGLHPLGVIPASLVVALSFLGGDQAQLTLGLPGAVKNVFQGSLLFLLLAFAVVARYRLVFVAPVADLAAESASAAAAAPKAGPGAEARPEG